MNNDNFVTTENSRTVHYEVWNIYENLQQYNRCIVIRQYCIVSGAVH